MDSTVLHRSPRLSLLCRSRRCPTTSCRSEAGCKVIYVSGPSRPTSRRRTSMRGHGWSCAAAHERRHDAERPTVAVAHCLPLAAEDRPGAAYRLRAAAVVLPLDILVRCTCRPVDLSAAGGRAPSCYSQSSGVSKMRSTTSFSCSPSGLAQPTRSGTVLAAPSRGLHSPW